MNGKQSRRIRKAVAREQIADPVVRNKKIKYLKKMITLGKFTFNKGGEYHGIK